MRHLRVAPLQVPLLPGGVVRPARRGPLVGPTRPAKALAPADPRAVRRAVPLPAITVPAEQHQPPATRTGEESVVLVERALVDGRAGQLAATG
jgi:hypothetical protein